MTIFTALSCYVTKLAYPESRFQIPLALLGVALFTTMLRNATFFSESALFPNFHGGAVLANLAMLALVVRGICRGTSSLAFFLLILIGTLSTFSDLIIWPQMVLPLLLALALTALLRTTTRNETIKMAWGLLLSCLFGIGARLLFYSHLAHQPRTLSSFFLRSPNRFHRYLSGLSDHFFGNHWMTFISCFVLGVVLLLLLFRALKNSGKFEVLNRIAPVSNHTPTFFLFACFTASVGCSMASSYFIWQKPEHIRYLHMLNVLPGIFLAILALGLLKTSSKYGYAIFAGLLIALIFGQSDSFGRLGTLVERGFSLSYPESVRCIDRSVEKFGLKYGLSEYWESNYVTFHSRAGLHVNQFYPNRGDRGINLSINNSAWYTPREVSNPHTPAHSFFLAKISKENDAVGRWGPPIHREACGNIVVEIYDKELISGNEISRLMRR